MWRRIGALLSADASKRVLRPPFQQRDSNVHSSTVRCAAATDVDLLPGTSAPLAFRARSRKTARSKKNPPSAAGASLGGSRHG